MAFAFGSVFNGNVPENCSDDGPLARYYLLNITLADKISIGLGGALTLVIICVFISELRFIFKFHEQNETTYTTIWLLALYPITSVTSLVAVLSPRSAILNEFVASGFLAVNLYKFVGLMVLYYGGEDMMVIKKRDTTINLRSPPIACCCFCCPTITSSRKNLRRMQWLVLQNAIVRPLFLFISGIMWTEEYYTKTLSPEYTSTYIQLITVISTLLAMYGLLVLFRSSRADLKHLHIGVKFICLQLVLIFMNLQTFIFNILATNNIPPCLNYISSRVRANGIHHLLMILEMFCLTWVARHFYLVDTNGQFTDLEKVTNNSIQYTDSKNGSGDNIQEVHENKLTIEP